MKLSEALQILHEARENALPFRVALACGFTPLHLETFLAAHLQRSLPGSCVELQTGRFGDLAGNVERISGCDAAVVVMEWQDLDPRLGYRNLGGWGPSEVNDIVANVQSSLARLASPLRRAATVPAAICMPTLPLPPVFSSPAFEAGQAELRLHATVADFAAEVSTHPSTRVVNMQRLGMRSPLAQRFDLRAELEAGFPYTLAHAGYVGEALARLIAPEAPKKGLITDLDDTLWRGLVGEDGPDAVSWDLAGHSQLHGLYQQLLRALAGQGVLIGIASKNDSAVVERAFARPDLLIGRDRIFPIEVHWEAKSKSVERILRIWNISADSVVFVDDSPLELAEVKAAFPDIETVQFSGRDYAGGEALLRGLRERFGKRTVSEEDALRLDSIRRAADFAADETAGSESEDFLAGAGAAITVDFNGSDPRVLELVNKTNQFNLNGIRRTEAEWRKQLSEPGAFAMAVSYEDKFGRLGKIAVLSGAQSGGIADVTTWVMSCRAFSRRVEHRCLEILFEGFGVDEVRFAFAATPKNGPLQEILEPYLEAKPTGPFTLSKARFAEKTPLLYHRVEYTSPHPEFKIEYSNG